MSTVPLENLEVPERMGIIPSILILLRCSLSREDLVSSEEFDPTALRVLHGQAPVADLGSD
jgi:hypothetical protein